VPSLKVKLNIHKRIRISIREQGRRSKRKEITEETAVSMVLQKDLGSNRDRHLRISTGLKLNYPQIVSPLNNSKPRLL
jgi:hypothetical protein